MTTGCIPYLCCCKRNRKRGTAVDPLPRPKAKHKRLRLCQNNEATASQCPIHLGIGIRCCDLVEQIGAWHNELGTLWLLLTFWLPWSSAHLARLGIAVPAALTLLQCPVDISHRRAVLPRASAVCTVGSLDAFLAVEYWWVWLMRNVHHSLGLWNLPAQSAMPPADFRQEDPLRLNSVEKLPNFTGRERTQ